ncbi:MAG: class I tRNA ligase family protein, partial [Chloroflexi bacterium]|nr:class I tRNA ligase family protein [Chloroflexota bacterium]
PFITEEIWQTLVAHLPEDKARPDSLMIADYPSATGFSDNRAEEEMASIIDIVRSVRNARAQSKIDPSRRIEARIHTSRKPVVESHRQAIETLARLQPLTILDPRIEKRDEGAQVVLLKDCEVVLPMSVDLQAEIQRLGRDRSDLQARIAGFTVRLSDTAFLSKAPAAVVEKEQAKLLDLRARLEKTEARLAELGGGTAP